MNYLVLLLGLLEDTGRAAGKKSERVRLVEEKK
jgi:hypothetical protein